MPENAVTQGAPYRLRCLGPVTLTAPDGAVRRFRTRKQMGLLVVLAKRPGRPHGREQLVEMLWGADEPVAARHSLAQSISIINKAFGHDAIRVSDKDHVELREGLVWLDAEEFERAVRDGRHADARALWRGQMLEGLWVQRAPGFEAWVDSERQRLTRLHRDALHAVMDTERAAGRWGEMRATADALLAEDPLDEAAMLGHLESLTLGGDRTQALRRFADFETRLKGELDAEPGAALKAWIKRQRKGEDAPAAPAPPLPRIAETQVLPTARPVYGREEEFKFLWDAWGAAQQSRGSFIILEGQAGIGKSALASKLANQVHVMGGAVCFVRCWRTEKSVPFAPITALIRQLMRLPGFVALNEVWIGELSRLVPELKERYPAAPSPMAIDDSARHRICDGTLQAAACVADEQPLMIIVDDIHNADEATLALLHYFGRQTGAQPVLLLCISRSGAAETNLEHTFFHSARDSRIARWLELGALPRSEGWRVTRKILAERGLEVPDWVVDALCTRSAGNPLQIIEAALGLPDRQGLGTDLWDHRLREHLGSEPDTFEASSVERLANLPSEARLLAGALAIAGRPLTDFELARLTELSTSDFVSAAYCLERTNFVRRSGATLSFVHDRYQSVALELIPEGGRISLHCALATLLEKTAADNPAARCEVALHFEHAGDAAAAREQAVQAARFAESIGAMREKAVALALARRVSDYTWERDAELGRCLLGLQDVAGLAVICEESAKRPLPRHAEGEFQYLKTIVEHNSGGNWSTTCESLLELIKKYQEFHSRGAAVLFLLRAADKSGNPDLARDMAKLIRREQRGRRSPYSLAAAAFIAIKLYTPRRALPWLAEVLAQALQLRDWDLAQWCRQGLGYVLLQLGRFDESIQQTEHGVALSKRMLSPLAEAMGLNDIAVSQIALGDFPAAERSLASSLEIRSSYPNWPLGIYPLVNSATLKFLQRNFSDSARLMEESYEAACRLDAWSIMVVASSGRALCAVRTGDMTAFSRWVELCHSLATSRKDQVSDRCLYESAIAWKGALIDDNPDEALASLQAVARSTRKRNIDHWLRMELEYIYIEERLTGMRSEDRRSALRGWGAQYKASAVIAAAT